MPLDPEKLNSLGQSIAARVAAQEAEDAAITEMATHLAPEMTAGEERAHSLAPVLIFHKLTDGTVESYWVPTLKGAH